MAVSAWQVHDTGLVAVLPRFRRLPGRRRHPGHGAPWPARVVLDVVDGDLLVGGEAGGAVGRWPAADVTVVRLSGGPPASFTLDLGVDGAHLLSTADPAALDELVAALVP